MEDDVFPRPEVEELLRRFELFEIFTDRDEAEYAELQRELTGYNANPTYLVLDSEDQLEVARFAYTNSVSDFLAFLRKGLSDRPAFQSRILYPAGLEIIEGGEPVTVLVRQGALEVDRGSEEDYLGEPVHAYRGAFRGSQDFRVGSDLEPGEYVLRVRLVTGLYQGSDRLETISIPARLEFEVIE